MKAEHRHELKTNDLSKALLTAGDYFREYGGRVALAIAIVILVVVLINTRINRSRANAAALRSELAIARATVRQLENVGLDATGAPAVTTGQFEEVRATLRRVQDDASDDALVAQAMIAEGDLNWAMANYPEIAPDSPATTRAATYTLEKDRSAYLKDAADLYQQVIERYPDQTLPVVNARFGLAAVAEQSRQWEQARAQYEHVTKLADDMAAFKQLAQARLTRLDDISKPILIGQVPEKIELPPLPPPDPFDLDAPTATRPGVSATPTTTTAPAAPPATAPATRTATTRPTTR